MKNYPRIVTPPPGPKAKALIARDSRVASTSLIKEYPLAIERGAGAMIEDVDGNRYLDFMAGIAVSATGYAHPKVVAAIEETARKFMHICATDFYYPQYTELAERLAALAPGKEPKRVFLTNSGTEAVEGAIKLARQRTGRYNVIAFEGAFHGRSMGALSLNASKLKHRHHFGPFMPGVYHLPYANPYRCSIGLPTTQCDEACECWSRLADSLFQHRLAPDEVAAVIVEPILGEGGYVIPPRDFLHYWRNFCDQHGALLIFDEVQSGIGRTGCMWAADLFDVVPDVILAAKGLGSGMPIGAIVAKESAMTWERGSHGSTFGGNPVSCAAALATLDLVEQGLMANASRMGALLVAGLRKLQAAHEFIGDVRGAGLMIGVEFVRDRTTKEHYHGIVPQIEEAAFKRGLLLLGCGQSTIRIAPPLLIDEEDVNTGLRIFEEALTSLRVPA
jgi:4-aminobutyrate aminotransferase